jgi:pimeloyl-ACP methyl ester carboxylesterase
MLSSVDWFRNGAPLDAGWEDLFRKMLLYGTGVRMLFPRVYSPDELQQIKAPVLLLIGDKEVIYRPEAAIQVAKRWVPRLQAAILPNTNHIAALSQPARVNQAILDFFA